MYVITHIIDNNEVHTYKYDRYGDFKIKFQEIRRRFKNSRIRRYCSDGGMLYEVVISSYSMRF